ncbi:MAG: phosphate/phosphite/phosphonate ABC transporter substrate-binding protein, partial [Proteobacteria bacterium]|nr:phosphate/phosphite/phosphonate ABC transporter substrate-binding protein [Pseudomonadota bacterium]
MVIKLETLLSSRPITYPRKAMIVIVRMTCLLLFILFQPQLLSADSQTISIGVLANSEEELVVKKWSATADYLSTSLPDYHFTIIPLGYKEIHKAVQLGRIDFVLANPAFYVELEK